MFVPTETPFTFPLLISFRLLLEIVGQARHSVARRRPSQKIQLLGGLFALRCCSCLLTWLGLPFYLVPNFFDLPERNALGFQMGQEVASLVFSPQRFLDALPLFAVLHYHPLQPFEPFRDFVQKCLKRLFCSCVNCAISILGTFVFFFLRAELSLPVVALFRVLKCKITVCFCLLSKEERNLLTCIT